MAEIRNGLVVVRSGEELAAAAGHPPSFDIPGVSTSAYSMRRNGGGSSFPPACIFEHDHPGEERHFLDSCAMCRRPLRTDQDIFMYRGNIPFCSEECRQDQIDRDEMKGRNWSNLAAKAMPSATVARKEEPVPVNRATGTVVA